MAYHLLDIFEVRTGKVQVRAERMSQVVVMEIVKACKLTYPAPGLVEAFERCAVKVAEYKLCILYFYPFAMAYLGFGITGKEDIDFIKGRIDIAVIGSKTISIMGKKGIEAVGDFIRGLR